MNGSLFQARTWVSFEFPGNQQSPFCRCRHSSRRVLCGSRLLDEIPLQVALESQCLSFLRLPVSFELLQSRFGRVHQKHKLLQL